MACWSPPLPAPPSIGVSGPNGYGPGSLSDAYWKVMLIFGWLEFVTMKGIPYGIDVPESPKSGWMSRPGPPLFEIHAALWLSTGRLDISVFQMSSAGKTGHPAMLGPDFCRTLTVVVVVDGRARRTVITGDGDGRAPTAVVVCC